MSYILNQLTLPQPKKFKRDFIEMSQSNLTITGRTTRRVSHRKEIFTLTFSNLAQTEIDSILALYQLNSILTFESTEANLTIAQTDVLFDLSPRSYPNTAREWRENINIILTEVK